VANESWNSQESRLAELNEQVNYLLRKYMSLSDTVQSLSDTVQSLKDAEWRRDKSFQ
jgi:hypothetical protein